MSAATVREAAKGHWPDILTRLGVPAEALNNRHQACPGCGGKNRFRFDDSEGRGTWICGGGGELQAGDGFDLLRHVLGWGFPRALAEVAAVLGVDGGPVPDHAALGGMVELEAAVNRELNILVMTLGQRVSDRETTKNRAFREARPDWRPLPHDHLERELLAARRLLVLLPWLYSAPEKEGPQR